jgi:hypothetical protein
MTPVFERCRARWTSAVVCVVALAVLVAAGCSDEAADGDAAVDADRDAGQTDTTRVDVPSEDTSVPPDARRPRDTDDNWDWDIGSSDADEEPFGLTEVVPPSGPVAGGNRVRIVGGGLTGDVSVFFGGRQLDVEVSGGQLVGYVPAASGPGPVTVKAIAPDGETVALVDGYEYVEGLKIDSITPARVPTSGGIEVTVMGRGFSPRTAVSVDGEPALRVEVIDDRRLRMLVPPGRRGFADVRVTTEAQSRLVERGIEYYEPLEISRVRPASGSVDGGDLVTIEGQGFAAETEFGFGGRDATLVDIDPQASTATVEAPAHPAGLVDVTAQTPTDNAIFQDAYLYREDDAPHLAAASPRFGPTSGGTQVELRGWGFDASGLEIQLGANAATIVDQAASYAVVETAAGSAGPVDIVMADSQGELDRLEDGFEYREDVWIDKVTPDESTTDGGVEVTITGTGFSDADRVAFGGIAAGFSVVSDTEISATVPAHGAGPVDVVVERNGIEATLRDGFLYTEELQVWGFDPARGAVAGGTYVELRGQGFYGALEVLFDDLEAPVVQRIDRNNVIAYTPPHAPGEVDVAVESDTQRAGAPFRYEYFNPSSRFGGASGASVDGAVNVSVFSRGGGPIPNAFVMLSTREDTRYQGVTDDNGQITLSGPDVLGPQMVTATARDYSSATIQTVDAENITLFLDFLNADPNPGGGNGEGPPYGTIRGEVTMQGKMADPHKQNTYDMAVVGTTRSGRYGRTINPGPGAIVIGSGDYEIRSRIGDLAVIALCGVQDEDTGTFEPKYMAIERYLFVSDRGEYDIDLMCDIPLDQTADVKLINPVYSPSGPDNNQVRVWWDLGFEGVFEGPEVARGLSDVLQVPSMPDNSGLLSDMSFTFVAGSFTGSYAPSTQTHLDGVVDLSQTIVMPPLLDVPEPISPPIGGTIQNNTITFQADGPYYPDFYSVSFLDEEGLPIWQFVIPGDENSVRIPEFPDFSFLPSDQRPNPLDTSRIYMTVIGIRAEPAFSFESFSYRDLSLDAWRAYSLTRWSMVPY